MYYIYIIQSRKDNKLYTGHTKDLANRIKEHNLGKVRSTRGRTPFKLKYTEEYETKEEAVAREKELKTGHWREIVKEFIK